VIKTIIPNVFIEKISLAPNLQPHSLEQEWFVALKNQSTLQAEQFDPVPEHAVHPYSHYNPQVPLESKDHP